MGAPKSAVEHLTLYREIQVHCKHLGYTAHKFVNLCETPNNSAEDALQQFKIP